MIVWFGIACFAAGIIIGIVYGRIGYEPVEEEDARNELRRELMDERNDQEDVGGAG